MINGKIQKEIEAWFNNVQELDMFRCRLEPDYLGEPNYPEEDYGDPLSPHCLTQFWKVEHYFPTKEMEFWISDYQGTHVIIDIPFDGITGPRASFYDKKRNLSISAELDLSIIDDIKSLIERFPEKFFWRHVQAATYYSNNGNTIKALEEIRLSIESGDEGNLEFYRLCFPREFRNSDAFKVLMKQSSKRYE